jgi:catechol 2,3-dioxygenase-like lactoylglutathione lyase family enzyme
MAEKVVPMIHVPDVRATVDWYESIGFKVIARYGDDADGNSFAMVSFGSGEVMFSSGGQPSTRRRREVDLYVYADDVDDLYLRLKDRVEVVEGLHDAFYGMREFIIRDLNRFWITFGQPSIFEVLMTAVWEGNIESVRAALSVALNRGGLKPETLTAALAADSSGDNTSSDAKNAEIREMLKQAGAIPPPKVEAEILQSYVGKYQGERGFEIHITFKDGKLFAALGRQQPLSLMAVDQTTFRPITFDNFGTVTFNVEVGKTMGCALNHGDGTVQLKRAEETKRS